MSRSLAIEGVFDIETEGWDRFVLGALLTSTGHYEEFRDGAAMARRLLTLGGQFWTWNGGRYDSLWLSQELRELGLRTPLTPAGTRITRLECEGLVVRDGMALWPVGLAKAARAAGITLTKETGLPCRCREPGCHGYCSIRRGMPESDYRKLSLYLRRDVEATLAVLLRLVEEAERCGYQLTGTVGGTAWKTAAAMADLPPADWADDARGYYYARSGYYGGRTEVGRPEAEEGWADDLHAAYPAALIATELPVGHRIRCRDDKARRAYARGREGIFSAKVRIPSEWHVPPLPMRTRTDRVVFPTGQLYGTWPGNELRYAEELGAEVTVQQALVWSDAERVLAPVCRTMFDNRAWCRAEGNDVLADWHKWAANSLTGKLAQDPEGDRIEINPERPRRCACAPDERADWGRRFCRRCRDWTQLDGPGGNVFAVPLWRIPVNGYVHWAAYLTGHTRVTLHRRIVADGEGGGTWIYSDTDSHLSTAECRVGLGDDVGQWGKHERIRHWRALAPKTYRYWDPAKREWVVRMKGIPGATREDFDRFAAGETLVQERGVMGLRSAARTGGSLFQRQHLERSSGADGILFGGRRLGADGRTHPLSWGEIQRWDGPKRR